MFGQALEVDEVIQVGKISNHEKPRSGYVTIRNTGAKTLLVEKVRTSCGECVSATLEKSKLLPGESGRLNYIVDIRENENGHVPSIFLVSNDVKSPVKRIRVETSSGVDFECSQREMVFDNSGGLVVPDAQTLSVKNVGSEPLEMVDVRVGSPYLKITGDVKARLNAGENVPFQVEPIEGIVPPCNSIGFLRVTAQKRDTALEYWLPINIRCQASVAAVVRQKPGLWHWAPEAVVFDLRAHDRVNMEKRLSVASGVYRSISGLFVESIDKRIQVVGEQGVELHAGRTMVYTLRLASNGLDSARNEFMLIRISGRVEGRKLEQFVSVQALRK